ncbi:hypothetical protein EDD17DRAFT_1521931 [Pisolithus thermaeus]|nr:hypothetical protein EDD17DRAFT_1521931 [Pisolithus thermaeus]
MEIAIKSVPSRLLTLFHLCFTCYSDLDSTIAFEQNTTPRLMDCLSADPLTKCLVSTELLGKACQNVRTAGM